MKYILSCVVAAALVAGIGFGVNFLDEQPTKQAQKQEIIAETHEIRKEDVAFETENPIVYEALLTLEETWNKLDKLEQDGVNIGNCKNDVVTLMTFVRETGKKIKVEQVEIPGQTLNCVETVVYSADTDKGGQVTAAAGIASFKEILSGENANNYDADGTEQNAIKHTKWSAVATILTKDTMYTKYFTDAHEYGHPANFDNEANYKDSEMDLKNNDLGREIGEKLYPEGKLTALNKLNDEIEKAKEQGRFTVIKK
ncbi:MAG: hypothetical protein IKJ55_06835 [Clostridia bacterium]|nr:hypothetical protein [Clostridia bacterium]